VLIGHPDVQACSLGEGGEAFINSQQQIQDSMLLLWWQWAEKRRQIRSGAEFDEAHTANYRAHSNAEPPHATLRAPRSRACGARKWNRPTSAPCLWYDS
jgi:hypothetical protein